MFSEYRETSRPFLIDTMVELGLEQFALVRFSRPVGCFGNCHLVLRNMGTHQERSDAVFGKFKDRDINLLDIESLPGTLQTNRLGQNPKEYRILQGFQRIVDTFQMDVEYIL